MCIWNNLLAYICEGGEGNFDPNKEPKWHYRGSKYGPFWAKNAKTWQTTHTTFSKNRVVGKVCIIHKAKAWITSFIGDQLKYWLIKLRKQVGHSTTRNLSDLDTQVTRTELDECLDICMRHTCIACKFCKWRWAPMQCSLTIWLCCCCC